MKYSLLIFLAVCLCGSLKAQDNTKYGFIVFNARFYDLENHWVVINKNPQTGEYIFGFVYLDMAAGFTAHIEGTFAVNNKGEVLRDSLQSKKANSRTIVRLGPTTKLLYPIPDAMLPDLYVKKIPDWLAIYHGPKEDRNSVSFKVAIGRHLNSAGAPKQALVYLEDVYKTEPHAAGLEFELTYSYNELMQYDKAIAILKSAIANAPDNALFYRELGFAYMKGKDNDNAIKTYTEGIEIAKKSDPARSRMEMVQNLNFLYCSLNQYDKAIALIKDVVAFTPKDIGAYILLGATYIKSGDAENAIKAYQQGIDMATLPQQAEAKAQIAFDIALVYRDKLRDLVQYNAWGQKAKDWAPVNSKTGQALKNMSFN